MNFILLTSILILAAALMAIVIWTYQAITKIK